MLKKEVLKPRLGWLPRLKSGWLPKPGWLTKAFDEALLRIARWAAENAGSNTRFTFDPILEEVPSPPWTKR